MNDKFLNDLCEFLKEKNIDCNAICPDTTFEELSLDELDVYDLCFDFEKLYDIVLNEENIIKIETVQDLYNFIKGEEEC